LAFGESHDHDLATVSGTKVAPEASVQVIAIAEPAPAVQCDVTEEAQMTHGRHRHVGQRHRDELPLAGSGSNPLGTQYSDGGMESREQVPGREDMVHGTVEVGRARDQR
jgi:hypothetical protein